MRELVADVCDAEIASLFSAELLRSRLGVPPAHDEAGAQAHGTYRKVGLGS